MKITIITLAALIAFTSTAQAAYTIIIPMEQAQGGTLPNGSISIKPRTPSLPAENWQPTEPLLGEWINNGAIYGCSNWTPATSTKPIGFIFQQTADDCKQDQTTTKQDREKETTTLAYRNVGQPTTETKSIVVYSSRQATGIKETWVTAPAIYTEWVNKGAIYGCTNWTPSASTVLKDEPFNQSATDCKQDQTSTKQDREQETTTLAYRNVGAPVSTTKTITASSSRTATGTAACSYSSDFWVSVLGGGVNYYSVYVNGVRIKTASGSSTTSFTLNDITYKRGTTRKYFSGNYDYYDVCK